MSANARAWLERLRKSEDDKRENDLIALREKQAEESEGPYAENLRRRLTNLNMRTKSAGKVGGSRYRNSRRRV
jgi:hypothetical protein